MRVSVFLIFIVLLTACDNTPSNSKTSEPQPSVTETLSEDPNTPTSNIPRKELLTFIWDPEELLHLEQYLPLDSDLIREKISTAEKEIPKDLTEEANLLFKTLAELKKTEALYLELRPDDTSYPYSISLSAPFGPDLVSARYSIVGRADDLNTININRINTLYKELIPAQELYSRSQLSLKTSTYLHKILSPIRDEILKLSSKTQKTALEQAYALQDANFKLKFPSPTLHDLLEQTQSAGLYSEKIKSNVIQIDLTPQINTQLNQHFFKEYTQNSRKQPKVVTLSEGGTLFFNNTLQRLHNISIQSNHIKTGSYTSTKQLDLYADEDAQEIFVYSMFREIRALFTKNLDLDSLGRRMLNILGIDDLGFTWHSKNILLKSPYYYRDGEATPITDEQIQSLGVLLIDELRQDPLFASILTDPHQTDVALSLSAKPTLRFMTQHTSRAMRLNAHFGFIDFSDFNYKQQNGALYALQHLPLSIELKGNYNTSTKSHLQFTSFYHIGNVGIGIKGGHTNVLPRHSLTQAQNEASLSVFYNSPNHWFVEASAGYTAIDHAVLSTATGTLQNLTIGYDSLWVTPFISASQRQLSIPTHNKQIIDYKITAGLETAKLQTQYGTHNITHHATFSGSYLPGGSLIFQGSFESSLLLQSGVWIKSNLGLSTNYDATLELQFTLQL